MTLHLVHCNRVAPQRWKNGGGLTRELLAWPRADGWSLRISVADIGADGPFSVFVGIDRWFAVVDGAGVLLRLPGDPRRIVADDPPLHFRGEAAPMCELLDGPTRDLNLMVRRDAGRGVMQRATLGEPLVSHARFRALFAADPCTLQIDGADALQLPPFVLAWSDSAQGMWRVAADAPVRAWWIHFEPHA